VEGAARDRSVMLIREIRYKKCRKCGRESDEEAFFSKNRIIRLSGEVYITTRSVCIGCELSARNEPTLEARALRKVYNSATHHAAKYKMSTANFCKKYGWDQKRMAYDVLHAHENTCAYCWFEYAKMGHGLDDVTLDIIDPDGEPYYHTNVRWCCRTCNLEKSTLPPEIWARRLIEWRNWKAWMDAINERPTYGLPLFNFPTLNLALAVLIVGAALIIP
jgi:hypothetical protein